MSECVEEGVVEGGTVYVLLGVESWKVTTLVFLFELVVVGDEEWRNVADVAIFGDIDEGDESESESSEAEDSEDEGPGKKKEQNGFSGIGEAALVVRLNAFRGFAWIMLEVQFMMFGKK